MKYTTLSEWADEINPWGCYDHAEAVKDFESETGKKAPFGGYAAKVANDTVGSFKGLGKPLDCPPDTQIADGWRMVEKVWDEYGKDEATEAERNAISMMNGRGSIADACIASLKRQGL